MYIEKKCILDVRSWKVFTIDVKFKVLDVRSWKVYTIDVIFKVYLDLFYSKVSSNHFLWNFT